VRYNVRALQRIERTGYKRETKQVRYNVRALQRIERADHGVKRKVTHCA